VWSVLARTTIPDAETAIAGRTRSSRRAIVEALGVERALRNGRVGARTREELVLTLSWAFDAGFRIPSSGRGWQRAYRDLSRQEPYLLSISGLSAIAKRLGTNFTELFDEAEALWRSRISDDHDAK
jgi:hypothetical protein